MAYPLLRLSGKYIRYWFTAMNGRGHGMHSPFVYDLIRNVLNDRNSYPEYQMIEALRQELLADQEWVEVLDLGAGSSKGTGKRRQVSAIARHAAKSPKFGQLLFRMARHYKPQSILELGTSLGISTAYLQMGNPSAHFITLEGAPAVAKKAAANFQKIGIGSVKQVTGHFDDTLPKALKELGSIDLAFVDGNHRKEPTLRYFHQLIPCVHNHSILVFDDVHWSAEMEQAWEIIKADPAVTATVDLFFTGIVFFRKEFLEKRHFQIRF